MKILRTSDAPNPKGGAVSGSATVPAAVAGVPPGTPPPQPPPTLEELAASSQRLLATLKTLHEDLTNHRDGLTAAKMPPLNQSWLTTMRGCVGTAIQHAHLHVQTMNAKVEATKAA